MKQRWVEALYAACVALVVVWAAGCVCGCVSATVESGVTKQAQIADGMAASITSGVTLDGGGKRPPTYEELVRYVFALRFGWHATAYDLGLEDAVPTLEAYAPPGGWNVVDPSPEATPSPAPSPR